MEGTETRTPDVKVTNGGTHVTIERDTSGKEMTTLDGDQVRYDSRQDETTRTQGEWPASADEHVRGLIRQAQMEREARENVRANHRNLNRMMTLLGALVIGLVVVFVLSHNGIPGLVALPSWCAGLAPYAFVITILMDSALALYGYIRHY